MLLQPLDTTLAFKAIALTPNLSGTEKQVAGMIVDSFNRKTGQCDPSLGRIARLLNISRRTVIRSMKKCETSHFFRKVRHGGKSHRNSYEPNWALFRALDTKWNASFYKKYVHAVSPKVSPSGCQSRHVAGDEGGTQTLLTNHSKKPSLLEPVSESIEDLNKSTSGKGPSGQESSRISRTLPSGSGIRSFEAARSAAERRWNAALHDQYAATPTIYGEIIDAIDPAMQRSATEAEIKRHGAGLAYILDQLKGLR